MSNNPSTAERDCCAEFRRMSLSRRSLLGGAVALGGTSIVLGSSVITASSAWASGTGTNVLVVLSMRGAADGLSLVVPYTDKAYYAGRPNIGLQASQLIQETRNGTFGLHPDLDGLLPLWRAGQLAPIVATGLPAPNRSHFLAMEEVEDADPGSDIRSGWLNRLIGTIGGDSPLQAFNLGGGVVPASLRGPEPTVGAGSVDDVGFAGDDQYDDGTRLGSLHTMYDGDTSPLGQGMAAAFDSVSQFKPAQAAADDTKSYPDTDLGAALAQVARIIRGNVGSRVITVDQGDWDMHSGIGNLDWGRMKDNASEFGDAIGAFFTDLGSQTGNVTLLALSEFGRRVVENDSWGLDHGYGNVMWVVGAGVKGGKYYGTMGPLSNTLDADVTVTTDYRSVLAEIVTTRFGASSATVFPDFSPTSVGVMTSL